jgi:hypothetical protein
LFEKGKKYSLFLKPTANGADIVLKFSVGDYIADEYKLPIDEITSDTWAALKGHKQNVYSRTLLNSGLRPQQYTKQLIGTTILCNKEQQPEEAEDINYYAPDAHSNEIEGEYITDDEYDSAE